LNEPLNPRAPAFQWYPSDFMADIHVQLMDWTQRGIYVWLIGICWLEKSIPGDLGALAKLTHIPVSWWEENGQGILVCFKPLANGNLIHPRIEKERDKQRAYREIKQRSGEIGAKNRWQKHNNMKKLNSNANVLPMANDSSSVFCLLSSSSDIASDASHPLASSDKKSSLSAEEIFTEIPCKGQVKIFQVSKQYLQEMRSLYPGIDIEKETLRAKGWIINNPSLGKTSRGMTRFLGSWYSKAQNNGNGALTKTAARQMTRQEEVFAFLDKKGEEERNGK